MITTRTPIAFVLAAAMVTAAGCAHRVGGRPAGVWELRGAVVDASGDRLRVRHKTGQVVQIILDDRTTVLRNDKPEERSALRRGTRVTVVIEPLAGGAQRAQIIRVYGGGIVNDPPSNAHDSGWFRNSAGIHDPRRAT